MLIAVIGATGRTGLEFVQEALEKGHNIKALVRNPQLFTLKDDKVTVEKANIFNDDDLATHFKDCDAVVSCLGVSTTFPVCRRMNFYEDSMKCIISGMRKSNIKRMICISSWFAKAEGDTNLFVECCMRPCFMGNFFRSIADMEDYLELECSDIEYTAVRPAYLSNGPSSGKPIVTDDANYMIKRMGLTAAIRRRDVAKFMLDCIEKGEWKNKCVTIGVE